MAKRDISNRKSMARRVTSLGTLVAFVLTTLWQSTQQLYAQDSLSLPSPGAMISITPAMVPPMLKGMKVDVSNPFAFNFILDSGNAAFNESGDRQGLSRLIKYFLAALTIPEKDLWVNLSPYERNRMIPTALGATEMGEDLLAQDYILKQLTASLIYPEKPLGEKFWTRVYAKAREVYGTSDVPIDTFNKIWIVPDKAVVYQHGNTVYVVKSYLKVMLEEDYLALEKRSEIGKNNTNDKAARAISSRLIREIIVPEVEKEVNAGQNFMRLRQIYASLVLAKWYKKTLKESLLNREYADRGKTGGVETQDSAAKERIYQQYLEAFRQGVFNYIKQDGDDGAGQPMSRKYFSGGLDMAQVPLHIEKEPVVLAGLAPDGKLSWIRGVYQEPRVSARFVNEYIAGQFASNGVREGKTIQLSGGRQVTVFLVPGLLAATGQFGHIGLGLKEKKEGEVTYKDEGGPVVYLDSRFADDSTVRNNEQYKVEKWESQREILGQERGLGRALNAREMRQWIQENMGQAAALLRQWDAEAPSLGALFAQERKGLPSSETIAETYVRADDFRDLNLAAGQTTVMPASPVYAVEPAGDYQHVLIEELARKEGISVDDLEANFERTVSMLEEQIRHTGFIEARDDVVVREMHDIYDRLVRALEPAHQKAMGAFYVVDSNAVNAFAVRNRTDVYFFKGLYETFYEIAQKLNVPLTKDMIAFILAHEMGHCLQHTSHEGLNVRDLDEKISPQLVQMIRNAEYDADSKGLEIMERAGFSVRGAADAMMFLEYISRSGQAENLLSSHPYCRLRMHRLSQIVFDQQTNVFSNVLAPRDPMPGNGLLKSREADFRHMMNKGEDDLIALAREAQDITALEGAVGMLFGRRRMNALKSLIYSDKLKKSFMQDVYLQAAIAAILGAIERSAYLSYKGINFSDMRAAAAINDFGKESATDDRWADRKEDDDVVKTVLDKVAESLKEDSLKNLRARLLGFASDIKRMSKRLEAGDFKDFLLPRESVEDLIALFAGGRDIGVHYMLEGEQKKKTPGDPSLVDNAIRDPRRLISAFFYAYYLAQESTVELSVPTTPVTVNLRRRTNTLYLENPAHRSCATDEERKSLQNIILLHYALAKKTSRGVVSEHFDFEFRPMSELIRVSDNTISVVFERCVQLLARRYPMPAAIALAKKRIEALFGSSRTPGESVLASQYHGDTPAGFLSELKGKLANVDAKKPKGVVEAPGVNDEVRTFIDSHPLIVFIREGIQRYGERVPAALAANFERNVYQLQDRKNEKALYDVYKRLIHCYSVEPSRESEVSPVFSSETALQFLHARQTQWVWEDLQFLPDWYVSEYISSNRYTVQGELSQALEQGVPLTDIFLFMKNRLGYEDRRKMFEMLLSSPKMREHLLTFFGTDLRNNPTRVIAWFLGMFSKRDALQLIDKSCEELWGPQIKEGGEGKNFDPLALALLEFVFGQTSSAFHASKEASLLYLSLVNDRISASGRAAEKGYVTEQVHRALMVLSGAVALSLEISCPSKVSPNGTPDFKGDATSIKSGLLDEKYGNYQSRFALHHFGWNDSKSSGQSVFVTSLSNLSIEQLKDLLRQRRRYLKSMVTVEYRGEEFSAAGLDDSFANLIMVIMVKKLTDPAWETAKSEVDRLDDLIDVKVEFLKYSWNQETLLLRSHRLILDANRVRAVAPDDVKRHFVGCAIPSNSWDPVWRQYMHDHQLVREFPAFVALFNSPNSGAELINNPLAFLKGHSYSRKVSYRQLIQKLFFESSSYSQLFEAYCQSEGKGVVYGTFRPLSERLEWLATALPHKSVIRDSIIDLWETDVLPEIVGDMPTLVKLARQAATEGGNVKNLWALLGEMDDDVGRLKRLSGQIAVPAARVRQLLDFYAAVIPLALSPQKIARYGATAYLLWAQLPGNDKIGLQSHVDAVTRFMPEPSVLRDELLMQIANRFAKQVEEGVLVAGKLYSNNLISRDKDVRTQDFVSDSLLHVFGAAKVEDRRDILLWIVGECDKPSAVVDIENKYRIDFTTLPQDVKLLPAVMRDKFLEGFMLGDNGVLDPQNASDRGVMSSFLERLFFFFFPEGAEGLGPEVRLLLARIFLVVMKAYPPYRRVQIIKALAALRTRADFNSTSMGERLAVLLGVLGPVGIKIAQYLSENETLVPDSRMRSSLGTLRHKAPEITKISAFSVLKNEVPMSERLVLGVGEARGVASIKQVNGGQWLDVEALAKLLLPGAGADADEIRRRMTLYAAGEMSIGDVVTFLLRVAEACAANLSAAEVRVVYKICRPNIETTLPFDYQALDAVAEDLEGMVFKGRVLSVKDLVETVKEWVDLERNFLNEARFHRALSGLDYTWAEGLARDAGLTLVHPRVFYATQRLIVEEEIPGVAVLTLAEGLKPVTREDVLDAGFPLADVEKVLDRLGKMTPRQAHVTLGLRRAGFPLDKIDALAERMMALDYGKVRELLRQLLLHQIFVDGVFHADLHQGNVLVTPDGRLAMIDRGNVGTLNKKQIEGAKELLKGLLLRDKDLIHEGIGAIFWNADYPGGEPVALCSITKEEIQAILDEGHDLKMTMNLVSVRAVQGTKNTVGGRSFSTFLKAFTQAMYLFPTDLANGLDTLKAIAQYVHLEQSELLTAAEEQARFVVASSVNTTAVETAGRSDSIVEIARGIFYERTAHSFMHSWWQSLLFRLVAWPLKSAESRASSVTRNIMGLVREYGPQIIEADMALFINKQDSPIEEVVQAMISVPHVEKFIVDYVNREIRARYGTSSRTSWIMPLLKGVLAIARPLTAMYVDVAKEWMNVSGRKYIESVAAGMSVHDAIQILADVFSSEFSGILRKMDAGRERVSLSGESNRRRGAADSSMEKSHPRSPGGIDFNMDLLELETTGQQIAFNEESTNAGPSVVHVNDGLLPVITGVIPIGNLSAAFDGVSSL